MTYCMLSDLCEINDFQTCEVTVAGLLSAAGCTFWTCTINLTLALTWFSVHCLTAFPTCIRASFSLVTRASSSL